jgi:peptide/nickel transport system permease protein
VPVRRILAIIGSALITIWGAVTLVFVLVRLTGDPAQLMSPPGAPAEQIEQTRQLLGLDAPLPVQYVRFLGQAVTGDFGNSYYFQGPALAVVGQRLTATLALAGCALVFAAVLGIGFGLVAAFTRERATDRVLRVVAMVGQAIPSFWLAPLLILVVSVQLRWTPVSGAAGPTSFILPTIALGALQLAVLFRVTRSAALEQLGQDHIRLARAKGSTAWHLAVAHVLPSAAIPIMTIIGLTTASLIGGSVIVETIFAWPGIGQLLVQAAEKRDFPVVQSVALVFAVGFVLVNTVIEILYRVVDPRLRQEAQR